MSCSAGIHVRGVVTDGRPGMTCGTVAGTGPEATGKTESLTCGIVMMRLPRKYHACDGKMEAFPYILNLPFTYVSSISHQTHGT